MAEFYNSYTNSNDGGHFGHRFRSWKASNDTRTDTNHDHVCKPVIVGPDGRDRPVVPDCPPKNHHQETMRMIEENAYQVQPASPYSREYMPSDRKTGFSGGMFQRQRPNYVSAEPAPITKAEWAAPSPNRVMEYLTGSAGPNSDARWARSNQNTSAEYLMGSSRPISDVGWARSGPPGWKTPPQAEGQLGKVTNDLGTTVDYLRGSEGPATVTTTGWSGQNTFAEYLMGSSRPISDVGWARPSSTGWKTPPQQEGRLGKVTNDVGTAADYLKGSVGPTTSTATGRWGPSGMFSETGGKIDSREARKRYGGQYM